VTRGIFDFRFLIFDLTAKGSASAPRVVSLFQSKI